MRLTLVLLAVVGLSQAGCSMLLAYSGREMNGFATREVVRARLGEPDVSGGDASGSFEEYVTRRKREEGDAGYAYGMAAVVTLGLSELVAVPLELYKAVRRIILGERHRFEYGPDGELRRWTIDGREPLFAGRPWSLMRQSMPVEEAGPPRGAIDGDEAR